MATVDQFSWSWNSREHIVDAQYCLLDIKEATNELQIRQLRPQVKISLELLAGRTLLNRYGVEEREEASLRG
jgi:hypothetical protein